MDSIYVIVFFAVLSIAFVFTAITINVRNKKSIIAKEQEEDFIDSFARKKSEKLKSQPGAMKFKTYMTLVIVLPILFGTAVWFLSNKIIYVAAVVVIGALIPELIVKVSANNQNKSFEERYARALRQISSSLRAGMTIQQAVSDLCQCPFIHHDIKKEFKKIDSDIKLGISVPEAFANMAQRIPTDDVKDVASAVKMQSIVGGSEAEAIEIISNNISSRMMLRKEVKTLFASVKMTALGMDVLPFVMVIGMFFLSPSYFAPCWKSTMGKIIIIAAFILMIIGSFVIRMFLRKVKELK